MARHRTARGHDRLPQAVGARVRLLRERARLSQAALSGPAISRSGVAKLEAGAFWPSLAALEQVASALGVKVRELIPSER